MNFFKSVSANPNATFETLEKKHEKWNKGLTNNLHHSALIKKAWKDGRMTKNIKGRTHSAETRALLSANHHRANAKPLMTPHGLFPSRGAYAQEINVAAQTVGYYINKWPEHYYYLETAQ